ncbi:hypothetical protein K439DRAFT_1409940 [Ramaria rubella]|nr:hypothetical protein K439DRAFT_1409940 [Ramaria rubella]
MSEIEQLTRAAYLSGLSPAKWRGLINALILKLDPHPADDLIASTICDTILLLLCSFHGDTTLREYLRSAITDHGLPIRVWHLLPAFLRSIRASDRHHDASTLDMICRLILNLHYETQGPPLGSLIPFSELPSELLNTISDSLYFLRLSYEFSASPFHHLTASASELSILILSCVGDISEVSATQATVLLSVVHDVLQVVALEDNVRQALESFLLSLSMLPGDGTKQAEEAEMFASFQLTPGKSETAGPNPSLDLLTGSLILGRLVSNRAIPSGSGCESVAVANLVAWYRVSLQALAVFYAHTMLSALACLSQIPQGSDTTRAFVWRCFIFGRLPQLLRKFQERIVIEAGSEADHSDTIAMQTAIAQVFTHNELLDLCELTVRTSSSSGSDAMEEDTKGSSFRLELLASLISSGLLDHTFAIELLPSLPHDFTTKLTIEAQEFGIEVITYIESKISLDVTFDDTIALLDRTNADYRSHATLADVLYKHFLHTCDMADVESLGRLCKVLSEHDYALDVLSLHRPLHDVIAHALACVEDYDLTTVGRCDPQTAVSHLGEVVLFLQSVLARYKISSSCFKVGDRILRSDLLCSTSVVYILDALSDEDKVTLDAWRQAIFDRSSEGIDDDILRSTQPRTLLRLSATLFSEAIAACVAQRIDVDALKNGVSYYLGPLLNWTLVGVVQALLKELGRSSFQSSPHMAVLEAILTDKSCPTVVLRITKQQILRLHSDPKAQVQIPGQTNMNTLVSRVLKVCTRSLTCLSVPLQPPRTPNQPGSWTSQPRNMIRHALALANAGKVPIFDIERCLAVLGVRPFFDHLWRELSAAASLGKVEICRRFATFVFSPTSGPTTESANNVPPLLPIFLHAYLPCLLTIIDAQTPPEQNLSVQLLASIVVSSLTFAVNFERALLKPMEGIGGRDIKVHNLPCSTMARHLRLDLRKSKGPSGLALFQKLSASSTFVSTFPTL